MKLLFVACLVFLCVSALSACCHGTKIIGEDGSEMIELRCSQGKMSGEEGSEIIELPSAEAGEETGAGSATTEDSKINLLVSNFFEPINLQPINLQLDEIKGFSTQLKSFQELSDEIAAENKKLEEKINFVNQILLSSKKQGEIKSEKLHPACSLSEEYEELRKYIDAKFEEVEHANYVFRGALLAMFDTLKGFEQILRGGFVITGSAPINWMSLFWSICALLLGLVGSLGIIRFLK